MLSDIELENLEFDYLETISSILKANIRNNILPALKSMNKISKHWVNIKKDEDKGYDVGFERVIYSLLQHGSSDLKNANSSPIGSDLMFECDDAIIHIDLKSNQPLTNIGDHWQPKIEANQTSYKINYNKKGQGGTFVFEGNLPNYYEVTNGSNTKELPTLTYFISILYKVNRGECEIININVSCMPNGQLTNVYGTEPIGAGGNISKKKCRFKMGRCKKFKLINKKRLNKIYVNKNYIENNSIPSKTQFLKFLS